MTLVHEQATGLGAKHGQYHENSLRALVSQTRVQTRRILLRWSRDLTAVIEALVLPVLFLLTLNIILGNVISQVTGHSALYGTVPLNALAATINGAVVGAIGLIGERSDGLLRRLWVVPVHRASGVLSRIVAETVRIMITTLVVLAAGMILGFRFHQGILASLTWFAVPLIFGLAFATLITMVALYTANNFLLETVTLVHVLAVVFSTGFLPARRMSFMPGTRGTAASVDAASTAGPVISRISVPPVTARSTRSRPASPVQPQPLASWRSVKAASSPFGA